MGRFQDGLYIGLQKTRFADVLPRDPGVTRAGLIFFGVLSARLYRCTAGYIGNLFCYWSEYLLHSFSIAVVGSAAGVVAAWQPLTTALNAGGHVLNDSKSEFWAPALDAFPTEVLPTWLAEHCQ